MSFFKKILTTGVKKIFKKKLFKKKKIKKSVFNQKIFPFWKVVSLY